MKYLSLFSGIGGFEVSINSVFPNAECLGFCEIDNVLSKFYQKKYPSHRPLGDVKLADFKLFNNQVDLLVAGFPCSDLSIFKVYRKGLEGEKSSLFLEIVRCIQECSPRYFLIENVARLPVKINEELDKVFGVKGIMLDSNCCSGQNRKRMFWCNWPLTNKLLFQPNPIISFESVLDSKKSVRLLKLSEEKTRFYSDDRTSMRRIRHISNKNKSGTLASYPSNVVIDTRFSPPMKRKMSINEMEKLQTFPLNYTKQLKKTKAEFGLKNAVTVDLVIAILQELSNCF